MTRTAIYCRYSSDLQNEKSIEDQERLCRGTAERNGWRVVEVYADYALSGASTATRPGWQSLMRDAADRKFDILLIEDIDRAFRNEADYHSARDRLDFLDIKIYSTQGNEITPLEGSLRAMVSANYLRDLRHKVRRGLAGVVHSGRHAGGRAYGYRAVEGKRGELVIDETEAAIVRRIFAEFAEGESPRAICARLNRDGVPPPRGHYWQPSALNGSRQRGSGILSNELYVGRIVWNKIRMVKNPATGKRVSRPNPPSEWQSADAPHLAIVDRDIWDRAQARRPQQAYTRPEQARRPRHLLSGLLRCGACGASMSARGADRKGERIICTQHKETGTCDHGRNYYAADIEAAVLDGLRDNLLNDLAASRFLETYMAERKRLAREGVDRRRSLERRLGEIKRKIKNAVDLILDGSSQGKALAASLVELEAEEETIEAELAELNGPAEVIALHPATVQGYRAKVDALAARLREQERPHAAELRDAVRELIHRIVIQPSKAGDPVVLDVEGQLSRLIAGAPVGRLVAGNGGSGGGI